MTAAAQPQISVTLVGFGYWGPNLARNVANSYDLDLVAVADTSASRRDAAHRAHPLATMYKSATEAIEHSPSDLVMIATPPWTHHELASRALRAGKHVLITKPFVTSSAEAHDLTAEAQRAARHLLVDHTFLFTGAVRAIRERRGSLGELLYYDATRTNLGTFQPDTDVLWDLAPHDLSILLSLVDSPVESVTTAAATHGPSAGPTMAYVTLRFENRVLANLHLNWMAPVKVRRTIIGGTNRMVVYDDAEASEKVKFYESGDLARGTADEDVVRRMIDYRVGDVLAPRLDQSEALAVELSHVARVIRGEEAPLSGVGLANRIIRIIEVAHESAATGSQVAVTI